MPGLRRDDKNKSTHRALLHQALRVACVCTHTHLILVTTPGGWYALFYLFTYFYLLSFVLFFFFLRASPWHMEVPRLGVESELLLPAYATATTTPDPRHVCDLHHSSQQCWILNPLSEARDQTCNLMVPAGFVSAAPRRERHLFFLLY